MNDRKGFLLYTSDAPALCLMPDEDLGALMKAVFCYADNGTQPQNLSLVAQVMFESLRYKLDADRIRYEEKCEHNRQNARKRYEKKEEQPKTQPEQSVPQTIPTDAKRYGSAGNVILTDEELDRFRSRYPSDWQSKIEKLSLFMASTGREYRDHFATLCLWAQQDKERNPDKSKESPPSYDLEKAERMALTVPKHHKRPGAPVHTD